MQALRMAAALALGLLESGCAKTHADAVDGTNEATALALVRADFRREVAEAPLPLPAGVGVKLFCCHYLSTTALPVSITIDLILPADDDPLAESPPTVTLAPYEVHIQAPVSILERPDYPATRRESFAKARDATAAVSIARSKLKGLARYRGWQRDGLRYRTLLYSPVPWNRNWNIYFSTIGTGPRMDNVDVTVDLVKGEVVSIYAGARHEELAL